MAFRGLNRGVEDKIDSWAIPPRVKREFLRGLTPLVDISLADIPLEDGRMFYVVSFADPDRVDHNYYFRVRICRNDSDFYIADVTVAFAMDSDGNIFWETDTGSP